MLVQLAFIIRLLGLHSVLFASFPLSDHSLLQAGTDKQQQQTVFHHRCYLALLTVETILFFVHLNILTHNVQFISTGTLAYS